MMLQKESVKTFVLVHINCEMYPTTEEKAWGGRAFMPETLSLLTGEICIPKTLFKKELYCKVGDNTTLHRSCCQAEIVCITLTPTRVCRREGIANQRRVANSPSLTVRVEVVD